MARQLSDEMRKFVDGKVVVVPSFPGKTGAIADYAQRISRELSSSFDIVNYDKANENHVLRMLLNDEVAFFISVAGIGDIFRNAEKAPEVIRPFHEGESRFICIDYEHAAWSHRTLARLPAGSIYTNGTLRHMSFANRLTQSDVILAWLPHGADPTTVTPWQERDLDIVFAGNLGEPPDVILQRWSEEFPPVIFNILKNGVDRFLATKDSILNIEDIFQGIEIIPFLDTLDYIKIIANFDIWARNYSRLAVLQGLEGVPLTIIGSGWESVRLPAGVECIGPRTPQEVEKFFRRSKIILNATAPYYSSHERVFAAMAQRAVAATTGVGFTNQAGVDEPLLHLPLHDARSVLAAAAHMANLEEVAVSGYKTFLSRHTWKHRVDTVIELMELTIRRRPPAN